MRALAEPQNERMWTRFLPFVLIFIILALSFSLMNCHGVTTRAESPVASNGPLTVEERASSPSSGRRPNLPSFESGWLSVQLWHGMIATIDNTYTPGFSGVTSETLYGTSKASFIFDAIIGAQAKGLVVREICELGIYAGSSSVLMMSAAPTAHWWGFDYAGESGERTKAAAALLLKSRPGYADFILGDTSQTLPKFMADHPSTRCDVVLLDAGKSYDMRSGDIRNTRKMSHPGTVILMDEVCDKECVMNTGPESKCHGPYAEPSRAYRKAVSEGIMEIVDCMEKPSIDYDFMCWARYLYP